MDGPITNPGGQGIVPATVVVAASDSRDTSRADLVCPGTSDEVTIHEARDRAATLGGEIYFLEGHYNISTPVEWNVTGLNIRCAMAPSAFFGTDKGTIFVAEAGFVGAYMMRVIANDQRFDNLVLNSSLRTTIGLRIEDSRFCQFGRVTVLEPSQIGIDFEGVAVLNSQHHFTVVTIIMATTSEITARGIVFDGTAPATGNTGHVFENVQMVVKAVATSYGVDFVQNVDTCQFNYLNVTNTGGALTAAVCFNSNNPATDRWVGDNRIMALVYEPGNAMQILGNTARLRKPNLVDFIKYDDGAIRGVGTNLIVTNWGPPPFEWWYFTESIDGFINSSVGGSVALGGNLLLLDSGAVNGQFAWLEKWVYGQSWAKRRRLRIEFQVTQTTDQNVWMLLGQPGVVDHMGFKVIDNTLFGTCADGAAESTLNMGAIAAATTYEIEAHFFPGFGTLFYLNRVYIGIVTANQPNDVTFGYIFNAYIITNANAVKQLWFLWQYYKQEGE